MYSSCSAFSEQLPGYKDISRKKNPILCEYLTDYAILLNSKLRLQPLTLMHMGDYYIATYDRNGKMIEECYNEKIAGTVKKYIRKIVKENLPPPLPDELEGDFFTLKITLFKSKVNLITFMKYNEYNYFRIEIDKKNNFPRKVKPSEVYLDGEDIIPGEIREMYVLIPGREQFYVGPYPGKNAEVPEPGKKSIFQFWNKK